VGGGVSVGGTCLWEGHSYDRRHIEGCPKSMGAVRLSCGSLRPPIVDCLEKASS